MARFLTFSCCALVAIGASGCRRGPSVPSPQTHRPVIFVGFDAADWSLLDDYIRRGVMPNLARMVSEGTGGRLKTISPPLSPIVWTTMMTGTDPLQHRILDFAQADPQTGVKEPITSSERRVPAIWNMASEEGKTSSVFGLWATYPAESIDGLIVSDRLFTFLYNESTPPAGVVFPSDRETWARAGLARAREQVNFDAVRAYLPWLDRADYDRVADADDPYAQPVSALRRMLVETTVYCDLSLEWLRRQHPDVTVVYLQSTDTVGHVFAPYVAPRQPEVSERDFERYRDVPERFFRLIDRRLGDYLEIARAERGVLMIASDHGFLWGDGRPTRLSSVATASAAKWHALEGIYEVWGDGVPARPGHTGHGDVKQIAATLLALAGLPSGRDVDGDPLEGASATRQPRADYAAHFTPPSAPQRSSAATADREALANLRSLGYIGAGESDRVASAGRGSTRTPASYNNEGVILKERRKFAPAIEAFEHALALDPNLASAQWNLSDVLYAMGQDLDRSDRLLVDAVKGGMPDGVKLVVGRAMAYQRSGDGERSLTLMNAAVERNPREPELWLFRGRYRIDAGDCDSAGADFDRAVALAPTDASAYAARGIAQLCTGDRVAARSAFEQSLRLDPQQPKIREYLNKVR